MAEGDPSVLAERTARLLDDVNLQVEQFDAADDRTAFLGYVGHADDSHEVLRETGRPVVAAFTTALREAGWPDVDRLVVRAFDPTEPRHRREGALEWEVTVDLAERFAAASDGDDEAGETPAAVVADAMATARMVYADGRVEPLSTRD
jgi:hypothetical protein